MTRSSWAGGDSSASWVGTDDREPSVQPLRRGVAADQGANAGAVGPEDVADVHDKVPVSVAEQLLQPVFQLLGWSPRDQRLMEREDETRARGRVTGASHGWSVRRNVARMDKLAPAAREIGGDGSPAVARARRCCYDSRMRSLILAILVVVAGVGLAAQAPRPAPFTPLPAPPDVAAPPADAVKTASGLASKVLTPGTGSARPSAEDFVTVHYTGWTTDGKMFDSSYARSAASTFPISRVIKGWGEGVQLMVAGEKRRLWIPKELAYEGQKGRPQGMLVFDIELVEIVPSPDKNPPPDVGAVPQDAQRTASGLAYKVLRAGTGEMKPTRNSRVTVHYSGWTTDGRLFDSSLMRGQPATLPDRRHRGLDRGLQLMVPGEKARFWIPERLA